MFHDFGEPLKNLGIFSTPGAGIKPTLLDPSWENSKLLFEDFPYVLYFIRRYIIS